MPIEIYRGDKIRLTLWGQLARFFSEDVIGNQTVVIVTSTTVQEYIGNNTNYGNQIVLFIYII
jgi:hypothetical protein